MERLKEKERLERAKRVQALREMTKLSRREFAKKTGIANITWVMPILKQKQQKRRNHFITM